MIEELAERATLLRPPGLGTVHCIKGLIQEESNSPAGVDPAGAVLVKRRSVPQQCYKVRNDESKSNQCDLRVQVSAWVHQRHLFSSVGCKQARGCENTTRIRGDLQDLVCTCVSIHRV